jgi:DNA-binding transcriptional ArsR family regulator
MVKLMVPRQRLAAVADGEGNRLHAPTDGRTAAVPEALADDVAKDLVRLFKLLADATRLRIVYFLMQQKEIHVRALCERLGQSQPAVSHHLSLLRSAGLIDARRQGKHNFYRLLPDGFQEVLDLVAERMRAKG